MDGPLLPEPLREVGLQTVLDEIRSLQVYRGQKAQDPAQRGRSIAPHKPLLVLLMLRLVAVEKRPRLLPFIEVEPALRALLVRYGAGKTQHPEYPFVRLAQAPRLWETTLPASAQASTEDVSAAYLRDFEIQAGFTSEAATAIAHPAAAGLITRYTLATWFAERTAAERFSLAEELGLAEAVLS